jgi:hypothetical protein
MPSPWGRPVYAPPSRRERAVAAICYWQSVVNGFEFGDQGYAERQLVLARKLLASITESNDDGPSAREFQGRPTRRT